MKYKNFIFDFDGTIADTFTESIIAINRVAQDFGLEKITEDKIPEIRRMTGSELISASGISKYKLPYLLYKTKKILNKSLDSIKVCNNMESTLKVMRSKGCNLGIITSNSKKNVRQFLALNNIDFFDFVISERNIFGKGKIILKTMSKFKMKPEETVYVGDELRDIEAARNAKIDAISVTWGFQAREMLEKHNGNNIIDESESLLNFAK